MYDFETIDLDFRPASDFRPRPLEDYRLAQVKGALIRAHLRVLLASERHVEVARILRNQRVSDPDCRALERIHSLYMGSNQLPNPRPGQVEIAQILYAHDHDIRDWHSCTGQPDRGKQRPRWERTKNHLIHKP